MRRSASEVIRNLEMRIARLESRKTANLDRKKLERACDKVEAELMKDIASRTEDMLEYYDTDNIWYDVAQEFPEIKTGDLDPMTEAKLERALKTEIAKEVAKVRSKAFRSVLEEAVKTWYEGNQPK